MWALCWCTPHTFPFLCLILELHFFQGFAMFTYFSLAKRYYQAWIETGHADFSEDEEYVRFLPLLLLLLDKKCNSCLSISPPFQSILFLNHCRMPFI